MAITRINNNQISDASAGNVFVGVNAAAKLQQFSITSQKIANNLVYNSDLTVSGNLTVNGQTTTIDTTIVTIEDPVILLASNQTGSPAVDIGFIGERGTSNNIAFVWDESSSEFVTVFTSDTITNTTVSISSYANFHTNDANIGGNLAVGGNISITGNVTSLNVTGNITGGNLLTPGVVTATGNITGGNLSAGSGTIVTTGNINGANVNASSGVTAGTTVIATGNVSGGNLTTTGITSTGSLTASTTIDATGNISGGNLTTAGITSTGSLTASTTINATGNITGGNVSAGAGIISTTGNINGGNVNATANITGTGAVFNGNVTAQNFFGNVAGNIDAGGTNTNIQFNDDDILAGSAAFTFDKTSNAVSATGNITGGNLITTGVTSTGSLTASTTINANGNITGGNLTTTGITSTGSLTASTTIDATGNITGGNLTTTGITSTGSLTASTTINATGNITGGNVSAGAGIISTTGNVNGGNVNATSGITAGTTVIAVGNVTGGNVTTVGNIDGANVNATSGITAGTTIVATGNITGGNVTTTGITSTGSLTALTTINATGNITGGNLITTGITRTGTLETTGNALIGGNLIVQGNITYINIDDLRVEDPIIILGTGPNGAPLTADDGLDRGVYMEYFETGLGNAFVGFKNSSGNMVIANDVFFTANDVVGINSYGTLEAGNLYIQSAVSTGNVAGGNLTTAGQVTATGNITGGNLITSGTFQSASITATGNITGANLNANLGVTATTVTATGNVTGGNVSAGSGIVSTTGNINGGNVNATSSITAGTTIAATGNISGGNLTTAGITNTGSLTALTTIDATGNITGGNLSAGSGIISTTGNINGANVNTSAGITAGTTITATGNVTGGNLNTAGITSTGSLTASTTIDATGNITGGNVSAGAGIVSTTGNVNGGNVNATGNVTGTGAVFSGNVTAANFIGNISGNIFSPGANTDIIFNDNGVANATAGFTFDKTTNVVSTTGAFSTTGNVDAANFNGGNLFNMTLGSRLLTNGNPIQGGSFDYSSLYVGFDGGDQGIALNSFGNAPVEINTGDGGANTYNWTFTADTGVFNAPGNITTTTGNINGGNINTAGQLQGGNIVITGDDITDTNGRVNFNTAGADVDFSVNGDTVANVFYVDAGTGTASFGSATQTTNAVVAFNATNSILMPVGNTAQRPATGVTGMMRFNTITNSVEVYDNSEWTAVGVPVFTVIDDQQFNGDGSTVAFTINSDQTTNSCIVSINGVLQIPTIAYSVSGTTLTFTEPPESGDIIDVRQITTTTTVTSISNSSGNAVIQVSDTTNDVSITGDLVPTSNVTFDLGSSTNRWKDGYFSGSSLILGNVVMKNVAGGNSIAFFGPDGTTPATIAASSVDTTQIASGTSSMAVIASGGNIRANVGGTTVQTISAGLVAITGDLSVTGNATLSGNILGDRIQNGTTQIDIQTPSGNANITVGATSNVAVFSTTGANITGTLGVTGNITGGNLSGTSIVGTLTTAAQTNITSVGTLSSVTVTANVAGGNLTTGGQVVATGNVNGGNLVATTAVSTSSIIKTGSNGVGNIGSSTSTFNTIFAKATSAQYADLAEKYTADAEYVPGTVVVFGGEKEVTVTSVDADRAVAGVVSTNPSYIMNAGLEAEYVATVALTGRVPTRVTGTVRKGDLMVSAGNGLARAEADPRVGTVIGKALENYEGTEGVIEVVVGRF